ncbi:MAG: gfo/Idh/MocA family oxidoreductase, partial [Chitinophagales bacterium]|nr:gfo/Idh/MocA family oxidoreductase [Chitinophagales bacterium]
ELNLITNKISAKGGLRKNHAEAMNMQPNLLADLDLADISVKAVASANTVADPLTSAHMRNLMECIRSRKQLNAPVEAGYAHSVASIMTNAAVRTGSKATFDEAKQEVMAGGKVFKY